MGIGECVVLLRLVQVEIAISRCGKGFGLILATESKSRQTEAIRLDTAFMHEIGEQTRVPRRFSEQRCWSFQ